MTKRILYLMHVPWGWIKQRPHFIAEGLSKKAEIQVVNSINYNCNELLKNETNIDRIKLYRLPVVNIKFVSIVFDNINKMLFHIQLRKYLRNADIIWFTSPTFISYFYKKDFINKIIVYDCMDDFLEFPAIKSNSKMFNKVYRCEKELYSISSFVLFSAQYLQSKLFNRYGYKDHVYVINNAIKEMHSNNLSISVPDSLDYYVRSKSFKIVYIGTISPWIDFSLLEKILGEFSNAEIFLFGPTEIETPQIDGLNFCGKLEHELIFPIMNMADVLIMPFIVNELIKSVNPVKLYEYIYSGKASIAPLYVESKFFDDYVYLYSDSNDCISILKRLYNNPKSKRNLSECRTFCENNTWLNRVDEIGKILNL